MCNLNYKNLSKSAINVVKLAMCDTFLYKQFIWFQMEPFNLFNIMNAFKDAIQH